MKKKLTKEQKEKRQHFLKVTKNVVFYISLALNVLVIIAFAVTGCSPKSNVQSIDRQDLGEATQLRKEKAFDFSNTNQNAIGFNLDNIDLLDNNFQYSGSFQSSVSNVYTMVNGGDNPYYVNQININCNIQHPVVNGNFLRLSTNLSNDENIYTYTQGVWVTNTHVIDGIFINTDNSVLNSTPLYLVLNSLFTRFQYQDYDLFSSKYNPYVYYPSSNGFIEVNDSSPESVSDPYVLKSSIFYIKGEAYNEMRIQWAKVKADTKYHIWRNGEEIATITTGSIVGTYYRYLNLVYARNTTTGAYTVVWQNYLTTSDNGEITMNTTATPFIDYNNQQVRLFAVNLYEATINGYVNGNSLTANYYGNSAVVETSTSNVFGLFTQAFSGFVAIFGIQLLPGITIGVLLFLPLVVIIIFAVIRIIKK